MTDKYMDINKDGSTKSLNLMIDGTSGNSDLELRVAEVMNEYFELWKKKQKAYGPKNISKFGELGCYIRATDKMERLYNYYFNNVDIAVTGDNAEDSWTDLLGYAMMGLMCLRNLWPDQFIFKKKA